MGKDQRGEFAFVPQIKQEDYQSLYRKKRLENVSIKIFMG